MRSVGVRTSLPPAVSVRWEVTPSPVMLADVVMSALKLTCRYATPMSIGVKEKSVMLFESEQLSASSGSPQFAIVSPSVWL